MFTLRSNIKYSVMETKKSDYKHTFLIIDVSNELMKINNKILLWSLYLKTAGNDIFIPW
jgi:hypothetical protein